MLDPLKRRAEEVVVQRTTNPAPAQAEAPPAVAPPLIALWPIAVDDPRKLTALAAPRPTAVVAVRRAALRPIISSAREMARLEAADAKPQAIHPSRQAGELPSRKIEPAPPEQPAAAAAPLATVPRAVSQWASAASEVEAPCQPATRRDLASSLPRELAALAPRPQGIMGYRVERKTYPADEAAAPQSPPAVKADQHAEVNVEELGTRIEGINLSLRNLESELSEKRDFTADELDSLLNRLDILVLRQKDLALFRNLIGPQEQARVAQIDSSRSVVGGMGNRIAELRTRIRENGPEAERTAALKHLDELSDRLATMTNEPVTPPPAPCRLAVAHKSRKTSRPFTGVFAAGGFGPGINALPTTG